ncbi:MAG: hypothetical protein HY832_02900 [Candidatus Aenigmarchaeota archaeon]|nr:hypothetical protein [Candidatus Aenigmarchaeota archaeon]
MDQKRVTAYKTSIQPLLAGKYIAQEGLVPHYVLTPEGKKISRARILATVVKKFMSENGTFAGLTLDDGTDTIRTTFFQDISLVEPIEEGDVVEVIGKVREYHDEVNLVGELVTKIIDPNLELLRELELKKQNKEFEKTKALVRQYQTEVGNIEELKQVMEEQFHISPDDVEGVVENELAGQKQKPERDNKILVLKLIEEHDTGAGCDYATLLSTSGLAENELDVVINELLEEGTCFEPKAGKIKKL